MRHDIEDLVQMTADKLERIYQEIDNLALSPVERAGLELAEELEIEKETNRDNENPQSGTSEPLEIWRIGSAWRKGLRPDETPLAASPNNPRLLENLTSKETRTPAETFALDLRAISHLQTGEPIPACLRSYLIDRILTLRHPKTAGGAPNVDEQRNFQFVVLIEELVSAFGVPAYASVENPDAGSACWIIAEASKRLGRFPHNATSIAKIYLKARKQI